MSAPAPFSEGRLAAHLVQLLRAVDLAARLTPRPPHDAPERDVLSLAARAASADRISLFEIEGALDDERPLTVHRIARFCAAHDLVAPVATFLPARSAFLLSCVSSGAATSLGPLPASEPFYEAHLALEPVVPRHVLLAPVAPPGDVAMVLEAARTGDQPFAPADQAALEAAARASFSLLRGLRREHTVRLLLTDLLPELLDPARAPTSLPARLRSWLESRSLSPDEHRALALATTIAELSEASPAAVDLVQSVLSATRKAFLSRVRSWSEVDDADR